MESCARGSGPPHLMTTKDDASLTLATTYFDDQYLEDLLQFTLWNGSGGLFFKKPKNISCLKRKNKLYQGNLY